MRKTSVIAVAVAAMTLSACGGDGSYNNQSEARRNCESAIDAKLKAPADANYDLVATKTSENRWIIEGTVDAPNSFGAKIRGTVFCEVGLFKSGVNVHVATLT